MENKRSFFSDIVRAVLFGLLTGTVVTLVFLLLFAAILTSADLPKSAVAVLSMLALAFGGLAGGFVTAKLYHKNGLFVGFLTGAVLFIIIMLISMLISSSGFTLQSLIKLLVTVICGSIGGVIGVNFKKRKKII